ncbi:MAG TPA: M50 family metallopeptidase [Candidatus Tumulicola sp.]|nr:M50 family metallopeptidase [Candidatus Tumulicola sp.]
MPTLLLIGLPNLLTIGQLAIFLLILGALIIFHEFGHFVLAKRAGVRVTDFAIGFGPSIVAFKRGDTTYRLNLLPLGGYCKMVGEDEKDDGSADPGNFQHKPLWSRFLIIAAGPVFNFLLGAIIFATIATSYGIPIAATNVVDIVQPGKPADRAGIVPGDQILAIDGQAFRSAEEMVTYIHGHADQTIAVDVQHDGTIRHLNIKTVSQTLFGRTFGAIGFIPRQRFERVGILRGVTWGFQTVGLTIYTQFAGLTQALWQRDASAVSGPVGIARNVIAAEQRGAESVLELAGLLSVVLGLFNLLPIPALDGGRLAFLVVEGIRGRPVDPEKEGLVHLTGFALLMVLFIFITYHDIAQWVSGRGL